MKLPDPWLLAAAALLAALLTAFFLLWFLRRRTRWRIRRRLSRARRGERDAEKLLARAGYVVEDRQITATVIYLVDDEPVEARVRADLLVRRGRRRFVAEVKTGAIARNPTAPATRRQMLEYHLVFDVDGVLFVDAESGWVCEVVLERFSRPSGDRRA